jgi:hypothetical protein
VVQKLFHQHHHHHHHYHLPEQAGTSKLRADIGRLIYIESSTKISHDSIYCCCC